MDRLIEIAGELERGTSWQVATLLDHQADLLLFHATSTYFEIEDLTPRSTTNGAANSATDTEHGEGGWMQDAARTASPRTPATTRPRS